MNIDFFIKGVLHDQGMAYEQMTPELLEKIKAQISTETIDAAKNHVINIYTQLQAEAAKQDTTPALADEEAPAPAAGEPAITEPPVEAQAALPLAADEEETTIEEPVKDAPGNETAPAEDPSPAATTPAPAAAPPAPPVTTKKEPPPPPQKPMHLPNAKEKELYSITVNWAALGLPNIGEHRIEGLIALGLNYDEDTCIIQGIPAKAGDHELKLFYRLKGHDYSKPELTRVINLFVNFDPRSLWTEHEPEADAPYKKGHTDTKLVTTGQKIMVAASKRGRSHAKDAKFREDDANICYDDVNHWHIMTVSDGAGSAKYSRKGSELVCNTIVDFLKSDYSKEQLKKGEALIAAYQAGPDDAAARKAVGDCLYQTICAAVIKAYAAIEQEATTNNYPVKDFSATTLVSICKKFSFGWFVGGFWIGDGGIGIYNKNGDPILLGAPDSGEYSGQTRFITMSEVRTAEGLYGRLRFKILDDFDALVLMTDGITDAWFHTDNNLQRKEKWDELFAEIQKTVQLDKYNKEIDKQLLAWLDFWVKGEYDDRTIAIMF